MITSFFGAGGASAFSAVASAAGAGASVGAGASAFGGSTSGVAAAELMAARQPLAPRARECYLLCSSCRPSPPRGEVQASRWRQPSVGGGGRCPPPRRVRVEGDACSDKVGASRAAGEPSFRGASRASWRRARSPRHCHCPRVYTEAGPVATAGRRHGAAAGEEGALRWVLGLAAECGGGVVLGVVEVSALGAPLWSSPELHLAIISSDPHVAALFLV